MPVMRKMMAAAVISNQSAAAITGSGWLSMRNLKVGAGLAAVVGVAGGKEDQILASWAAEVVALGLAMDSRMELSAWIFFMR